MRILARLFGASVALWALVAGADAQPRLNIGQNQIRFVVPGPPGGPAGATVQLLANKIGALLGQVVIADFRPGAGGNIALTNVAQGKPDGSAILFTAPYLVSNPFFQKIAGDPNSVAPVILINKGVGVLLVHPETGPKTVQELVARVKAAPDKVSCAATTVALSLVSCHVFAQHAGKMLMVGYQGNAQASAAVARSEVDVLFDFVNVALGPVKEGRLRALAVTSKTPAPEFKDLPQTSSFAPGFDITGWQGVAVARDTPRDIVMAFNEAFNKTLQDVEVRKLFETAGLEIGGGSPEDFGALLKRDHEFYGRIAREAKIEPQ